MAVFLSPKVSLLLDALVRDPAAPIGVSFVWTDGFPWQIEIKDAQALHEYLTDAVVEEREAARREGHDRGHKEGFQQRWEKGRIAAVKQARRAGKKKPGQGSIPGPIPVP